MRLASERSTNGRGFPNIACDPAGCQHNHPPLCPSPTRGRQMRAHRPPPPLDLMPHMLSRVRFLALPVSFAISRIAILDIPLAQPCARDQHTHTSPSHALLARNVLPPRPPPLGLARHNLLRVAHLPAHADVAAPRRRHLARPPRAPRPRPQQVVLHAGPQFLCAVRGGGRRAPAGGVGAPRGVDGLGPGNLRSVFAVFAQKMRGRRQGGRGRGR